MTHPHINDEQMAAVLRAWLREAPAAQPDRSRAVGDVISGTLNDWNLIVEPVTVRCDDGVVDGTGESYTM